MARFSTTVLFAAALAVTVAVMTPAAEAQTECVSKLVPCVNFLNTTTKPSTECCNSIKEAVAKDLTCLCTIYTTPGLLNQFNVSVSQALGLSRRCGVSADISACNASGAGGAGAPSPSSSGSSLPPPGTAGKDNGAAHKLASYGITTVILSLVLTMFF